ncbi:carbon-nitrogen family hydrolase [Tepidibacillus infernus]|uniref:carbon-nitrogen family hydrolase n=1 Tax=Tepidibacillus TaxID=1494427 RepID=UPI0008535936|nr:carbon-nitrogen family hydrolase [Tepidibacillus sp. HK-1]GBF11103.1 2-oxoglutaramate amidase [Tepidibacillus sp. HK-1]
MDKIKVSAIQMDIQFGQSEVNRQRLVDTMHRALKQQQSNVVLAPEMWNLGYDLENALKNGDRDGEMVKSSFTAIAKQYGSYIIPGSVANVRNIKVFNTTYVIDNHGDVRGYYDKIHLFRLMNEEKYLEPGNKRFTFDLYGHKAGIVICYDIRFPELIRSMALDGMEVLFVPAEWPHPRLYHWRSLLIARAIENQMFVVATNRVGSDPNNTFFGHSMIIDPWGEVIAEGTEEEEIITAELDLSIVPEIRNRIPVFKDRKEEFYF